jgi:hypothetical protein
MSSDPSSRVGIRLATPADRDALLVLLPAAAHQYIATRSAISCASSTCCCPPHRAPLVAETAVPSVAAGRWLPLEHGDGEHG